MIIIPEIETVLILVPRTGTKSLRRAIAEAYPAAMRIYRHMEADGVPQGYDRWRRVGVVREPVERLWSLYRFLQVMAGERDGKGKWEPAYVAAQRRSAEMPFSDWIVDNQTVFTSPYDSADNGRFWPGFTVRHPLPENRKSQFIYLRPDLGTEIIRFELLDELAGSLGLSLPHEHQLSGDPVPNLSLRACQHIDSCMAWDIAVTREQANDTRLRGGRGGG